jgi:hypothetical protein
MLSCGSICFTFGRMLKTRINYTTTFESTSRSQRSTVGIIVPDTVLAADLCNFPNSYYDSLGVTDLKKVQAMTET